MEERRFDDLTRALGRGMSRRTVLKGLVGAAVGGALAAVGVRAPRLADAAVPDCNGIPYDPNSQCCVPAGVQPLHPIANLSLCPDRVPHPGHEPEVNGCGPAGGLFSFIIPNKIGPWYDPRTVDLTPWCNNHDVCYDTCNNDKNYCDWTFLLEMRAACAEVYPGQDFYNLHRRTVCQSKVFLYYLAVALGGHDAYQSAQKGACDCCSNCHECGGLDDERCCGGTCHEECPDGTKRDSQTCDCVCEESCPAGQHQNPDTCECEDLCAGVTCSECHTCNPETGDCIPSDDGLVCGTEQVCCGGVCKDDCDCPPNRILCGGVCCEQNEICVEGACQAPTGCETACGPDEICCNEFGILDETGHTETWVCKKTSEYKICPVTPSVLGRGKRDPYICCPIDLDCCGGTGDLFSTCGGANGMCCAAGTSECGDMCCDFGWDEGHCAFLETGYTCIPNPA